ncbi:MAG: hypothetical protein OHK0039_09700 [Bacteroidia bacterium]
MPPLLSDAQTAPLSPDSAEAICDYLRSRPDAPADSLLRLADRAASHEPVRPLLRGKIDREAALILFGADRHAEAIARIQAAGQHFLQVADSTRWAQALADQGLMHYYLGDDAAALACYQEAAACLDRQGQPSSSLFNNIAIIYRKQGDYAQAIALYHRSLALKRAAGDSAGVATSAKNLGLLYSYLPDTARAFAWLARAAVGYESLGMTAEVAAVQAARGATYLNFGQYEQAAVSYALAYRGWQDHPEAPDRHQAGYGLAQVAMARKQWPTAEAYLREALQQARAGGRREDIQVLLQDLAAVLKERQQYAAAYEALHEALLRKDSLTEERRQALAGEMQARFEVQQIGEQARQQALAYAQRERQGLWIIGLSALALVVIGGFLWTIARQNVLLRRQQRVITQALADKEAVMQEMHHRIKNNLQFLSSLLSLQARDADADGAREVLLSSRSRVLSMALVHQHLYEEAGRTAIRMDAYLRKLIDEVMDSLHQPEVQIDLELDLAPLHLDLDQAIPVALITHEALVNALKYAFADQTSGHLRVSLQAGVGQASLHIEDDGVGATSLREGFGQRLMHLLAERLRGTLVITRQPGMRIQVDFPFSNPPYALTS